MMSVPAPRKFFATAIFSLAAVLTPAQAHASPANPTTQELKFVHALEAAGFVSIDGDDTGLISEGYMMCSMLEDGATKGQVMGAIIKNSNGRVTIDGAKTLVSLSVKYLCPEEG